MMSPRAKCDGSSKTDQTRKRPQLRPKGHLPLTPMNSPDESEIRRASDHNHAVQGEPPVFRGGPARAVETTCTGGPLRSGQTTTMRKFIIAVTGGTVILIGLAMVVLPGPALIVIPAGLAILASEFLWARRALKKCQHIAHATRRRAGRWWPFTRNTRGNPSVGYPGA